QARLAQPVFLIVLANRLDAGRAWAEYAMFPFAFLALLSTGLMLVGIWSPGRTAGCPCTMVFWSIVGSLPSLYLGAASVNALPELRHLRRVSRRARVDATGETSLRQPSVPFTA